MADDQTNPSPASPESVENETTPASPSTPTQSISSLSSGATDEHELKISGDVVEDLGNDLFKFLNFDVLKEESKFNDSVELMLTKLDEFFSLVDMIRSDTSLCLQQTMPDIQDKCKEMEVVFEKIDRLEEFVNIVQKSVAVTEEKVNKAESDFGTVGGFMKKLSSFISRKQSPAVTPLRNKGPEYVPPEVFSTRDFFRSSSDADPAAATSASSPPPTPPASASPSPSAKSAEDNQAAGGPAT